MSLNVVRYFVRAVFFVTFEPLAVLEAYFVFQIALSCGIRFDLRKFMLEIELNGEIH